MESLTNQQYSSYSELTNIHIETPSKTVSQKVKANWDAIAKPLDSMGAFEDIICKIGSILGTDKIDVSKKAVIIMCADNGIVEEGVSQCGQEVTLAVAKSMAKNQSSVGKMASHINADTIPVDIGINSSEEVEGLLNKKVRKGTRNFLKEEAMTSEEALKAISTGIDMVRNCKDKGYKLLATGEMGIGNTTTSSAISAALLGCKVEDVTGRGAGLSDKGLERKIAVIKEALDKYDLRDKDPFTILRKVGGLDIAGLTGLCIGGALYHVPIVLDGFISMAAGLVAERICPGVKDYLISSHNGKEPAIKLILEELSLKPVIDARLALGEGTGSVMLFSLLDMAMCIYDNQTSFQDIEVEEYQRFV